MLTRDHRGHARRSADLAGRIGAIAELCDDGVEARFSPLDELATFAFIMLDELLRRVARAGGHERGEAAIPN